MCWCWGAFQAFYGIEASFISKSWRQHLACLLSGLTLIALVLPHWNCTLYIYNFFFLLYCFNIQKLWQVKPNTINAGKWHTRTHHACAFYLGGQNQSHAPFLQRNDVPGAFSCLGCLHSSTSGFRWSTWSHVSFFFFLWDQSTMVCFSLDYLNVMQRIVKSQNWKGVFRPLECSKQSHQAVRYSWGIGKGNL